MSAAEDIEAINDFFHRAGNEPKTANARAAFNEWVRWYEATKPGPLGWWSDSDKDHASNLRNAYVRANAVTTQEKTAAERVIKTGLSTEQMMGETDRRNADGNVEERPPGAVHQWWFAPAVAAGVTAVVLLVAPKVASIYLGHKL
jgi:hypothetical protein